MDLVIINVYLDKLFQSIYLVIFGISVGGKYYHIPAGGYYYSPPSRRLSMYLPTHFKDCKG